MNKKSDNISHGKPSAGLNPLNASQPSDSAKIRTDVEETKSRLIALAEKWKGVNSVYGFLTDLWQALGIAVLDATQQKGGNPSRYAAFDIGNGLIVTIRASTHNADAGNYVKDGNVHGDSNLSIVLQKRNRRNTFRQNDAVKLEEYVYVDSRIASVENPLSQIAISLVNYLTYGNYVDTTGVAIPHKSPITGYKLNKNMKKTITESQLRQIVKESIRKVLREAKKDKIFKSKEDATYWSDLHDPDKRRWDDENFGDTDPFKDYVYHCFADGYDYCGDDYNNELAGEYNRRLRKRLATKGGQMSFDYENHNAQNRARLANQHRDLERDYEAKRINNLNVDGKGGTELFRRAYVAGMDPEKVDALVGGRYK